MIYSIQSESDAVSAASEEQARGIAEINIAFSEMSQGNASNASQVKILTQLSDALDKNSLRLSESSKIMERILNGAEEESNQAEEVSLDYLNPVIKPPAAA